MGLGDRGGRGVGAGLGAVGIDLSRSDAVAAAARAADPRADTAAVTWIGYGAPSSLPAAAGDRAARDGSSVAIDFPRGLTSRRDLERHRFDYSFSGLKTAVARWVEARAASGEPVPVADVAASFQEAVCDVLTRKAVDAAASEGIEDILIGGGVAANSRLRVLAEERQELAQALRDLGIVMRELRTFVRENKGALSRNIKGLNRVTSTLVKRRGELDEILRVAPAALNNLFLAGNTDAGTLDTRANLG